jgi:hypothetical protein
LFFLTTFGGVSSDCSGAEGKKGQLGKFEMLEPEGNSDNGQAEYGTDHQMEQA